LGSSLLQIIPFIFENQEYFLVKKAENDKLNKLFLGSEKFEKFEELEIDFNFDSIFSISQFSYQKPSFEIVYKNSNSDSNELEKVILELEKQNQELNFRAKER